MNETLFNSARWEVPNRYLDMMSDPLWQAPLKPWSPANDFDHPELVKSYLEKELSRLYGERSLGSLAATGLPSTVAAPAPEKTYTVAELHEELLGEGERLLLEAKAILDVQAGEEADRAAALSALGFSVSASVKEAAGRQKKRKEAAERHALLTHYASRYPQHRFIDEPGIKRICEKYGLVMAGVGLYTGTIPADKQEQILSFRVHVEDLEFHVAPTSLSTNGYVTGCGLQMAATKNDFDTRGLQQAGHRLVPEPRVYDPIVLQPVKGGFLVVSCWGEEASDPDVVNANHN